MTLDEIYAPVRDSLKLVEDRLVEVTRSEIPLLQQLLEYSLLTGGKRVRPALTLLCGKFRSYDLNLLIPMATAAEVLHIGTLVHDDIIDNSPLRRGKPALHRKWGTNCALLLGDHLFARAGELAAATENMRIIKRFSRTLMTISGGEIRQTGLTFDLASARDDYYNWISDKTACLFVMAAEGGSVLSGCTDEQVEALRDYALNFGLAFQVIDDILDFVGDVQVLGKPVGSDLSEGAITLPTIIYAEKNRGEDIIYRILLDRDRSQVPLAVEKIKASGAIDDCRNIARDFYTKACRSLEKLPDCEARQSLQGLVTFVIERDR